MTVAIVVVVIAIVVAVVIAIVVAVAVAIVAVVVAVVVVAAVINQCYSFPSIRLSTSSFLFLRVLPYGNGFAERVFAVQ